MIKKYVTTRVMNTMTITENFGQAKIKFEFERGNTARGVAAAYYTNDPFRQRVLEKSPNFNVLYRLAATINEESDNVATQPSTAATGAQETVQTETVATAPKANNTMKDKTFADGAEVIVYAMENYGEQCETVEAAVKLLRKHKINAIIG